MNQKHAPERRVLVELERRQKPMNSLPYKTCSKCGVEKPATLEYFYSDKRLKYGVRSICIECQKIKAQAYRETNREALATKNKEYIANNPDKRKETISRYYIENKDKVRDYQRKRRETNPDKERARKQHWRDANRDKVRAQDKRYRTIKPEMDRQKQGRRRARKLAAEGDFTAQQINDLYDKQQGKCFYCGDNLNGAYHVDHYYPLVRGGSNDISNIRIACPTCNRRKGDKLPEDFKPE